MLSFILRIAFWRVKGDASDAGNRRHRRPESGRAGEGVSAGTRCTERVLPEPKQGQTGLVLGYGNTSASQFVSGIRRIQALITQQQDGKG